MVIGGDIQCILSPISGPISEHTREEERRKVGTFADQFIWSRVKPNSFAVESAISSNHTQFIPVHGRRLSERISCVRSRERTRATMPRYRTGAPLSPLWWRGASGGAVEFETSLTIATGTNRVLGSTGSLAAFPFLHRLCPWLVVVAVQALSLGGMVRQLEEHDGRQQTCGTAYQIVNKKAKADAKVGRWRRRRRRR